MKKLKFKLKNKMISVLMALLVIPAVLALIATGWLIEGSLTIKVINSVLIVTSGLLITSYFISKKLVKFVIEPINYTTGSLSWIAQDIKVGKCDLTQPLEGNDNPLRRILANACNELISTFADMIREISESTQQVANDTNRMVSITKQSQEGIVQQQSEAEKVTAAMTQMTISVEDVSKNACSGASIAKETAKESQKGAKVVQDTIQGINTLANNVELAANVIRELEQDSDSIGSVLDVIQGIAEQTNLLALNAAIEAARAGEQGLGFAVVADEVRSLASRTQESTQEIQAIIENLQTRSKQAATVMNDGQKQALVSVELAQSAGQALKQISASIEELDNVSTQIASSANQQGVVANEISRNVLNINEVSVANAESARLSTRTSQDLSSSAGRVDGLIGSLKV